jgi:hypothetical protein
MGRAGSTLLGLLLVYFVASKSQGRQPTARSRRASTLPVGTGREVPIKRTGEDTFEAWVRHRMALAVVTLAALEPPVEKIDDVAIALLAQWAHETAKGRAEFNFNLGGWTARTGDDFHTANDRLTGSRFHWTAYPDLPTAVDDQIKRLIVGFPSAWALLLAAPLSSEWIEELGRAGYFTADPTDYARAWQALDAEVRSVPR